MPTPASRAEFSSVNIRRRAEKPEKARLKVLMVHAKTVVGFLLVVLAGRDACCFHAFNKPYFSSSLEKLGKHQMKKHAFSYHMIFPGLGVVGPAELLGRVAEVGLKLKLRSHGQVKVSVASSASQLMSGKVDSVTVEGTEWTSPKQLTCRQLRVEVGATAIDLPGLLQRQEIRILTPGKGLACIALNSRDWSSLLVHPLVSGVTPLVGSPPEPLRFLRQGRIEVENRRALLAVNAGGKVLRFSLEQSPKSDTHGKGGGGALVRPLRQTSMEVRNMEEEVEEEALALALSAWFSQLVLDLDGYDICDKIK